ncbi:MAG TPA: hypothetical protein VFU21_12170, partial [Kofleriaceae bacterium]|nr:hypothetical protein [Kofleriaceae bacterium]
MIRPAVILALGAAFLSMALVFVAKTFADAVFLAEFGVVYVPHFYVAQAAGLILSSAAYGAALRRGPSAPLDLAILLCFAVTAALGPVAVRAGGPPVFGLALALTVLSTLASLAVWNAATAIVSGRRSRWFLPRAGAAATAGAVVGGFGSSAVVGALTIDALGPVIAGMAAVMVAIRVMLVRGSSEWRSRLPEVRTRALAERKKRRARAGTETGTRTPHRRLVFVLAVATIVEAFLTAFVDFGFKAEVAAEYRDPDDIGLFFALFYGVSNALLLILQLFASSRLLATRSLRFSLSLEPGALLLAGIAWAIFPVLAIGALARGLESVMKFGVARPAQEVALTPLTEVERKRWKVLLRGVYNQGGGAAAGLLLVAIAPLLGASSTVLPIATALTALTWLVLQQLASDRYVDTLGSALGLRKLSLRDQRDEGGTIDRVGMARIVELTGSADENEAQFGRELLVTFAHDGRLLAPHVGKGPPAQREALYRILAARPHKACAPALREAMAGETASDGAAAACLDALAAYGDPSQIERARALVAGHEVDEVDAPPVRWAAWTYLAQVGALDGESGAVERLLGVALARDGGRAADVLRALTARGGMPVVDAEHMVERAAAAEEETARKNGLLACAALGWPRLLGKVLEAMSGRESWLDEVVAQLDPTALASFLKMEEYRRAP